MPLIKKKDSAGNQVLEFAIKRVGKDALEVLELSYYDIPWSWICGSLTRECILNGFKKPEGCALGLVGMNAGLAKYYVKEVEKFDGLTNKYTKTGEIQVSGIFDQGEMYGDPKAAEAIMCLFLAIPEDWIVHKEGWSAFEDEAYQSLIDNIIVPEAADAIVSYNDGNISRAQAAGWFCNAIGIARQRKLDGKRAEPWFDVENGDE